MTFGSTAILSDANHIFKPKVNLKSCEKLHWQRATKKHIYSTFNTFNVAREHSNSSLTKGKIKVLQTLAILIPLGLRD